LRSVLEQAGYPTWVDEHEILPGDDLPGSIAKALADASVFLVVISKHSLASRWLTYELRLATHRMIEGQLVVIPVRIDEAEPPPEIRSLLWADFRTDFGSGWRVLDAALERSQSQSGDQLQIRDRDALEQALPMGDRNGPRLRKILSAYLPEVFSTLRTLEARTGYTSGRSRSNLVDGLAHLATLAQRDELTVQEQTEQIQHVEEHCRRAMTDGAEEVALSRVQDVAQLWDDYRRKVLPFREHGVLRGVPAHSALEGLRTQIATTAANAVGRRRSPAWEDARSAAVEWHEAATLCEELTDRLRECVVAAEALDRPDRVEAG